jgi:hypothetical protein
MKTLSAQDIQRTIARLSDPAVNFRLELASTPHVARRIVQTLPGVKALIENGPEVADALLDLLKDEKTLRNENLALISLYILWSYPSERVKVALAKPITERRFTGFNSQFAAETFLKAAGIETLRKDAIAVALREARKIQITDSTLMKIRKTNVQKMATQKKQAGRVSRGVSKKKSPAVKK